MLVVLAFASVGCMDDLVDPNTPSAESGDEVQFGLSLSGPETRTIYGQEGTNSFPIYWVNGDKVKVYSPQCLDGRNNAEYKVIVPSGSTQNYAEKLTATGVAGVQWGTEGNATFYSIYPSANTTISGEEGSVTASLKIPFTQSLTHTLVDGVYYAADMSSVIMYAKTTASKTDQAVNLKYTPYSTVLEFEINANFSEANASMFVQSLTLEAPEATNIAGNFDFVFTSNNQQPSISTTGGTNSVTLQFAVQPELKSTSPTLKAKMCLVPISSVTSLDGWTVSITVRDGDNKVKTYNLTLDQADNVSTALAAGKVHKITLPPLTATKGWEYKPQNWMPQLPEYKDIYLTELSIPGAWYAGAKVSDGYQSTQSISDLWTSGIRAFAVETKCVSTSIDLWITTAPLATPSGVVVSGTADNASISTAAGENTLGTGGTNNKVYKEGSGNIKIETVIKNIIACLSSQSSEDKEFAVLVLNYAGEGSSGLRPVDFGAWLNLLYDAYNTLTSEEKKYIYQDEINANTTIGQVVNKLIIKVNVDANIAKGGHVLYDLSLYKDERTYSYANNLPALFSYSPFVSQLGADALSTPKFSQMYWKNWEDSYRNLITEPKGFSWCFSSANRTAVDGSTTDIPTYAQRKAALNTMIEYSREIYENSTHNVWFYFNAGGTQTTNSSNTTTNAGAFATEMNPWLLNVINLKVNGGYDAEGNYYAADPSPLGIVMFNQCMSDAGKSITRAIIEMNNKFKLKRITDPIDEEEVENDDVL